MTDFQPPLRSRSWLGVAASEPVRASTEGKTTTRLVRRLADDVRLARRSYRAAATRWVAIGLASMATCLFMVWVGNEIGGSPGYLYGEFRVDGWYAGFMTAFSSFLLGSGAVSLLMVAALLRRGAGPRRLTFPWVVAACGLFVLGADDLLMVHEIVGYRLAAAGVPQVFGISQDNYLVIAYGLTGVLILGRLLEGLRRYWRAIFPLVLALFLFALTELFDHLIPLVASDGIQTFLAPTDRIAKTLGTVMTFAFTQTLLYEVATRND